MNSGPRPNKLFARFAAPSRRIAHISIAANASTLIR
jgi:hypothetical protein